jgi:hypothetical protein
MKMNTPMSFPWTYRKRYSADDPPPPPPPDCEACGEKMCWEGNECQCCGAMGCSECGEITSDGSVCAKCLKERYEYLHGDTP